MQKPPLVIQHLSKNYGSLKAVSEVSLEIKKGEIYGLLGPNGAGKTSIISCIVGLEKPSSGQIHLFGQEITHNHDRQSKLKIGFVPQEIINHGFFTVDEILGFYSGYFGILNNREKIDSLLKDLQLYEHKDKKVKQLSGGMKRRLLIAKALVHDPSLVILDEPTAGVDVELRNSLWELVKKLKDKGVAILLTTHYLEEAEKLCDRVTVLDRGQVKATGETQGLIQKLTQRWVKIQYKGCVENIEHSYLVSKQKGLLELRIPSSFPIGQLFSELQIKKEDILDLVISEGSLEDVFKFVLHDKGENQNV